MFSSLLGGAAGGPDMMSIFNNPALMNMVRNFRLIINALIDHILGITVCSKSSSSRIVIDFEKYRLCFFVCCPFRMANLVTNLGGQEGGQVGLEALLQTYELAFERFLL